LKLTGVFSRLVLVLLVSPMLASPLLPHASAAPFIFYVSPLQQVVAAGSTAILNVTVISPGVVQTVTVEQDSPITIPTSLSFAPHNFTLATDASQSYIVSAYTKLDQLGTFYIMFKATSHPVVTVEWYSVTVTTRGEPDFTVTAGPTQLTTSSPFGYNVNITAGASKQVTVTVTSYYNFTGPVELSVSTFASTNQFSYSLSPQGVTLTENKTATSTLTVTAPPGATYGGNWISINGTSSTTVHSVPLIVTVPMDYNLTPRDSPITVTAGSSQSTFLTLTTNGFARTLNITATTPPGLTATLSQDRTSVNRTITSFTTTLTITAATGTLPGTYYLNVTGTTVIFVQPIYGGGTGYEKTETSKTTTIPVIVQASPGPSQSSVPPPAKILGLDPVIFYSLVGSLAILSVVAVSVVVLKRKPPSQT